MTASPPPPWDLRPPVPATVQSPAPEPPPAAAARKTRHEPSYRGPRAAKVFMGEGARERPCLCCRRVFPSAGNHNRLCDHCGSRAE
ncbi:hypothetical protein [Ferrovibrio sp.]|uniref:hypothetical protein n=1 Tax=Ferrovibrio sp. TaxID=1917215 RepID=UPI003D122B29